MDLSAFIKKQSASEYRQTLENADWLQNNMSPYFFNAMADQLDALALLAREMSGLKKNRRIILVDRDPELTVACVNQPGSLYDTLRRIGDREISYAMFSHSSSVMPGMQEELEVQRFEFDRRFQHEVDLTQPFNIPPSLLRGVRRELKVRFPEFDLKKTEKLLSILMHNNENYILISPLTRVAWLIWLFDRGNASGGLFIDTETVEREAAFETRVLFAVGNPPQRGFLLQTLEVFNRLGLGIRRAYCHTITNGVHPYFLGAFFVQSREGEECTPGSALAEQLTRELSATQILATSSEAYSHFVTKRFLSGEDAALVEAFIAFCHTTLAHCQPDRFGLDDVRRAFFDHPEMSQLLVTLFRKRFDPDLPSREEYEKLLLETEEAVTGYNTGHRWLDTSRRIVYRTCQIFIIHTLKTNFFISQKQALAFRLSPAYLRELGNEFSSDLPESLPFRVSFFYSRFGSGYHVGFSDIARGGWRTVIARNADDFTTACNTIFREVYVLANTQHLKNKDIYEGGSKMALVMDLTDLDQNGSEEETCRLYKLQYSVANAFLDIFVTEGGRAKERRVVDYYGDDEPIEIGPDENMHDGMIEAIAALSRKRGYMLGVGIMSSKRFGINHKEYGVTSTGIVVFAGITMAETVGKDIYNDPFTLKMTGGPNGDVAGNGLRILLQQCPFMKLTLLLDGTAALHDPDGIDRVALQELVLKHDLDMFRPECLGIGAFIIYRTGKRMDGLRELHRKVSRTVDGLLEEWLEIDDFYREYNSVVFSVQTDIFIPAGGRPETIDSQNWQNFMTPNGVPSSRVIVEGANSFVTPEARLALQRAGVIIMRDASANKCGVISSSYEIIANLLLSESEFMAHKDLYVSDVLKILKKRASDEANLILKRFREPENTLSCTQISDSLSLEINANYAKLFQFFELHTDLRIKEPFISAIYRHLPTLLVQNRNFRQRIKRLPGKYLSAILAAEIGSSLVYNYSGNADFEAMIRRHLDTLDNKNIHNRNIIC